MRRLPDPTPPSAPFTPPLRGARRFGGLRALVARTEAATPAGRDRAVDGLRALAITGVVVGHFMVMALAVHPDGTLRVTSPLIHLPGLAPASWILQMLGLFFLVGGYATARSWDRARERQGKPAARSATVRAVVGDGRAYRRWVGARLARLGRPVVASTAILGAALPVLALAGVPAGTLRTTAVLVVQPLWFIGVYLVITALTPLGVALERRMGVWVAAPPLAIVAAVDLLRYGPWHADVPGWVAMINILPGWAFGYLLGIAWAHGRIGRRTAAVLAAGGLALAAGLVLWFGYPVSMVGVPGAGRVNSHPPSLLVLALAAAQSGAAILARDRVAALLRRPAVWTGVALVNLSAMTIFCWHQIALMLLSGTTLALVPSGLPGLHDAPSSLTWVGCRFGWLAVHLVVLGCLVTWARRFESPWTRLPAGGKAVALALAAGFGAYCCVAIW